MAWTNAGFDGTVSETVWPRLAAHVGVAGAVVANASDMQVVGVAGTRTVSVALGEYYADGVYSKNDAAETLTLAANATGATRYDTICVKRDWSTNVTSYVAKTGGTTSAVVSGLANAPGVLVERPLAVVAVANGATSLVGAAVDDYRHWHTHAVVGATAPRNPPLNTLWVNPAKGFFRWNGTAWAEALDDTGWQQWSTPSGLTGFIYARIRNGVAYMTYRVATAGTGPSTRLFRNFPHPWRPTTTVWAASYVDGAPGVATMNTNGDFTIAASSLTGANVLAFGDISFPLS